TRQLQPRRRPGPVAQVLGPRREAVLSLLPRRRQPVLDHLGLRPLPHALARSRPGGRPALAVRGRRRAGVEAREADALARRRDALRDRAEPAAALLRPALDGLPAARAERRRRTAGLRARRLGRDAGAGVP